MFKPFEKISRQTFLILVVSQVLFTLVIWQLSPGGLIPQPTHVVAALGQLVTTRLLIDNLLVSLVLTLQAMFYSIVIIIQAMAKYCRTISKTWSALPTIMTSYRLSQRLYPSV